MEIVIAFWGFVIGVLVGKGGGGNGKGSAS